MIDPRALARLAISQTDEALAADCNWEPVAGFQRLRAVHRPTGIRVEVDARKTEAQTRFIALLYLRNRCYDMLRLRGRPKR
jgi:hypothetical protein